MLNINYIWRFLFLLLPVFGAGQNTSTLDSLLHVRNNTPLNSTERAEALLALASYYHSHNPLESIPYAEELIALGQSINSDEYTYLGYMAVGVGYAILGSALDKAVENFIKGLDIARAHTEQKWKLRQIKANMNIAGVHWVKKDIPKALRYTYDYKAQLEATDDSITLAAAYESLALMHEVSEAWDSVFYYINKAEALYKSTNQNTRLLEIRRIEGVALSNSNKKEEAYKALNQLVRDAQELKDTMLLINTYADLSTLYLKMNQTAESVVMAHRGLKLSHDRSMTAKKAAYNHVLYSIYSTLEQVDSALYYYIAYSKAKEQILNEEKIKAIEEMETRYHLKQRNQENKLLKDTVASKNFQNILLMLSSFLFLLLMLIIIFFYHKLRKRKLELESLNLEVININTQLLSLINEKKHMVNLIAHDIRNPLSIIQLNTHALTDDSFSKAERVELLDEVENATAAIDQASLKIMEIENKSEGSIPVQMDNFDITPALLNTQKEFLTYAKSKKIKLIFDIPEATSLIKGDPFLFRHIMSNFISNAVKYAPHNSEVKVSLKEAKRLIAIKVIDRGPGLKKDDQQRIFSKGSTTANEPTSGERKLGEGLYLTRRYVEAMNGIIEVESEPGKGTTFTILFPKVA